LPTGAISGGHTLYNHRNNDGPEWQWSMEPSGGGSGGNRTHVSCCFLSPVYDRIQPFIEGRQLYRGSFPLAKSDLISTRTRSALRVQSGFTTPCPPSSRRGMVEDGTVAMQPSRRSRSSGVLLLWQMRCSRSVRVARLKTRSQEVIPHMIETNSPPSKFVII